MPVPANLRNGDANDQVIQRVVFQPGASEHALYDRLSSLNENSVRAERERFGITVPSGVILALNTYFNSFFEKYWRRYTSLGALRLRIRLSGSGTIKLYRETAKQGIRLLFERQFELMDQEIFLDVPEGDPGTLHFEVTATTSVILHRGEWLAVASVGAPVRMVAGYCTFNREQYLVENLKLLLGDAEVNRALAKIVVVDQGTRRLNDFAPFEQIDKSRVRIVEQGNFGGAGGFTRVILEALDTADATHVLLMDDDALLEPESVFRASAFLSLAKGELAVGGQMLDQLKPCEVYEAGSTIRPARLGVRTPLNRVSVALPHELQPFLKVTPTDYNAWWFFAVPLQTVQKQGLPLPMFLRGDDAEYGCRLLKAGVPTVTLPGVAVWHEPFYLKKGGWYSYYDLRNFLALTAIHYRVTRWQVAATFGMRLIKHLLMLDYGRAALLCDAVDEFCQGPELFEAHPGSCHRSLESRHRERTQQPVAVSHVPRQSRMAPARTWLALGIRLGCSLLRQALCASPSAATHASCSLSDKQADWWTLGKADVIAVEQQGHHGLHLEMRRSRRSFYQALVRGTKSAWRLCHCYGSVVSQWRAAYPRMRTQSFWHTYLGMTKHTAEVQKRRAA